MIVLSSEAYNDDADIGEPTATNAQVVVAETAEASNLKEDCGSSDSTGTTFENASEEIAYTTLRVDCIDDMKALVQFSDHDDVLPLIVISMVKLTTGILLDVVGVMVGDTNGDTLAGSNDGNEVGCIDGSVDGIKEGDVGCKVG